MSIIRNYDASKLGMTLGGGADRVYAAWDSSIVDPSYKKSGDTYTINMYSHTDSGKKLPGPP